MVSARTPAAAAPVGVATRALEEFELASEEPAMPRSGIVDIREPGAGPPGSRGSLARVAVTAPAVALLLAPATTSTLGFDGSSATKPSRRRPVAS